jgi:hypothetical protein
MWHGKYKSRNAGLSAASKRAKAQSRFNIIRHASTDGKTKEQAANEARLTLAGLNTLLYRELGSTKWPLDLGQEKGS